MSDFNKDKFMKYVIALADHEAWGHFGYEPSEFGKFDPKLQALMEASVRNRQAVYDYCKSKIDKKVG